APLFAPGPELGVEAEAAGNEPSEVPGTGAGPARDSIPTLGPSLRSGTFGSEPTRRARETQPVRRAEGRPTDEPAAAPRRRVEATPAGEMRPPTVDAGEVHTPSAVHAAPPPPAGLRHRDAARPDRAFRSAEAAAEGNAPIVRISIGRIEVRAVAAS